LKETVPAATHIGMMLNPTNPNYPRNVTEAEKGARSLGLELHKFDLRTPDDISNAFERASRQSADALLIGIEAITQANALLITQLAAKYRLPAIYAAREFVETGGLMAYGVKYPDLYRRAAAFVDKIIKGAKPADLPIEQPTKFELVINLKTARALSLEVPPTLLARADEVIE
jgi:putative tryptophan/tyrosine transport system substrate-binding protein